MNTIIHYPTRGWLLLTEKWPEKPMYSFDSAHYVSARSQVDAEYNDAVAHCLSTAIEIAKEDWKDLEGHFPEVVGFKLHHPYSVDAEFEIDIICINTCYGECRYDNRGGCNGVKKIARLVKAKETVREEGFSGELRVIATNSFLENPTDSVTSDRTAATGKWEPKITNEFLDANQFNSGDRVNHFLVNALKQLTADEIAILGKSLIARGTKPTESQDELWLSASRLFRVNEDGSLQIPMRELGGRFRIERI